MITPNYLLVFDFDGTAFRTFEPSPNGIDVENAYKLVVGKVFGEEGLKGYQNVGGLGNRAPSELIKLLLANDESGILQEKALGLMATKVEGKNIAQTNAEDAIIEFCIEEKVSILEAEIGTVFPNGEMWPRPTEGFLRFWKQVQTINKEGLVDIKTAFVSSGHKNFIEKTFKARELELPNFLITEDNVRERKYPLEITRRVKPGQLQMAMAHIEWLKSWGLSSAEARTAFADLSKKYMLYFGDDMKKDGQTAENAGIGFGQYVEGSSYKRATGSFSFGNWAEIGQRLIDGRLALERFTPIGELFSLNTSAIESTKRNRTPEGYSGMGYNTRK